MNNVSLKTEICVVANYNTSYYAPLDWNNSRQMIFRQSQSNISTDGQSFLVSGTNLVPATNFSPSFF
jgi:hypothetical protein